MRSIPATHQTLTMCRFTQTCTLNKPIFCLDYGERLKNQLLAPHRMGNPHGLKAHDGKITTERVNDMWGMDTTSIITTTEGQAAIFFAVDHCSMECIGIHMAKRGTRFEALEPTCLCAGT